MYYKDANLFDDKCFEHIHLEGEVLYRKTHDIREGVLKQRHYDAVL